MANLYWAIGLTGGADGYLDSISVSNANGYGDGIELQAGDACIVISPTDGVRFFVVIDEPGAVEDGNNIIIPDDNTGDLHWVKCQIGVPAGICVPFVGSTVPDGWTNYNGTVGIHNPGDLIRKA